MATNNVEAPVDGSLATAGSAVREKWCGPEKTELESFDCVLRVPGVYVEPGVALEFAGWTLSPARELSACSDEQMSAAQTRGCWAHGKVWALPEAVELAARSRVNDVVLNILRLFLEPIPERTYEPALPNALSEFFFSSRTSREWTRVTSDKLGSPCLVLTCETVARLKESRAFQRASLVAASRSTSLLQRAILLALVQWGASTQVGPLEIQLRSFLAVFEGLFNLESHADGLQMASRLISGPEEGALEPGKVKDILDKLYVVQANLLHEGYGPAFGPSLVRPEDVYIARHFSRQAILHMLLSYYDTPTRRELVRELQRSHSRVRSLRVRAVP